MGGRLLRSMRLGAVNAAFWNLACQAILSGSSFLLNLLLIRATAPEDFGTFAILMASVYLLGNASQSLICYPLTLRLGRAPERFAGLVTAGLGGTLPLAAALALVLGGIAFVKIGPLAAALVMLSFVALQLQVTYRRALIAVGRFRLCALGDAIAYLGSLAVLAGWWALGGHVALPLVFAAQAIAFLTSLLVLTRLNRAPGAPAFGAGARLVIEDLRVSAPSLGVALVDAAAAQLGLYVVDYFHGARETSQLAAALTVIGVLHPLIFAMANTMVPRVAGAYARGAAAGRDEGFRVAALYAAPFAIVLLAIWFEAGPLVGMISGGRYTGMADVFRWLCPAYAVLYLFWSANAFLLGLGRSSIALAMQVARLAATVVLALVLVRAYGVPGAAATYLFAGLAGLASAGLCASRSFRASRAFLRA